MTFPEDPGASQLPPSLGWKDQARRLTRRVVVVVSRGIIGLLAIYGAWSFGQRYGEKAQEMPQAPRGKAPANAVVPAPRSLPRPETFEAPSEDAIPPVPEDRGSSGGPGSGSLLKANPSQGEEAIDGGRTLPVEFPEQPLLVPVLGVRREDLRDSFEERRGGGGARRHEAIDIHAPRNRPVIAADSGTILSVAESTLGGLSVRQLSSTGKHVYFYAHLERYVAGLKKGDTVRRGQTLGYVGTSGNAADNAPHLHFAISDVSKDPRQRRGPPINPYLLLRSDGKENG